MELSTSTPTSSIKELFRTTTQDQASEEIQFPGGGYIKTGIKSSSSFFGFFRALFRTSAERENNKQTITQARQDVITLFGDRSDALKKFDNAFSSKLASGSPLTEEALLRFKKSLTTNDQDVLEGSEESVVQQSRSDSMRCFANVKALKDPNAAVKGDPLEISYWEKAGNYYEHESKAEARGDKDYADQCWQIAEGYRKAAVAYGEGKKDLAHYLAEETEFLRAEKISLRDNYQDEADRFNGLKKYYSKAIQAEENGMPAVAQYWSKAAKCLDEAYRARWNHCEQECQKLMKAVNIYTNAAYLASNADASSAASMTEETDRKYAAVFQNYPKR